MTYMPPMAMADAIADLYAAAAAALPSVERCVTPLGQLVKACSLNRQELVRLTSRSACDLLLERGGLVEPPAGLDSVPLAGFLYVCADFGCIFVEHGDPVTRRRFSVAHELGHYLLHFQPVIMARELDGEECEVIEALPSFSDDEVDEPPVGQITLTRESSVN